jgi:hypothetical protein
MCAHDAAGDAADRLPRPRLGSMRFSRISLQNRQRNSTGLRRDRASNRYPSPISFSQAFQDDAPAAAPVKREFKGLGAPSLPAAKDAPKVAAEKPKKAEAVESTSGGLDPRSVALPGAWRVRA